MAPPAGGRRRIATEGGSCRRNRPLGRLSIMTDEKEYGSLGRLAPEWDGDGRERNLTADDIYERFFGWVEDVKGIERHALRRPMHWPPLLLHRSDQGAGVGEILRLGRSVRPRQCRHDHRRQPHQRGRADHLLHRRNPRQSGFARRHPCRCGPRGDGRIPLLR